MLLILSIGGIPYHPQVLRGASAPPLFPLQRTVSLNLAADEMVLALTPPERRVALAYLADDLTFSHVMGATQAIAHKVKANAEQGIALQPD